MTFIFPLSSSATGAEATSSTVIEKQRDSIFPLVAERMFTCSLHHASPQFETEIVKVLNSHQLTPIVLQYLGTYSIIPSGRLINLATDVPDVLLFQIVQLLHDSKSICRLLINLPSRIRLSIFKSRLRDLLVSSILRSARGNFERIPRFIKEGIFNDELVKNRVHTLDLNNCPLDNLSNTLYMVFRYFPNLRKVELENCNLSDENMEKFLGHFQTSLISRVSDVVTPLFSSSTHIRQLECLSIARNRGITSGIALKQFSNIQHLDLGGCTALRESVILHIAASLPTLEHLSLVGCSHVTDTETLSLTLGCPNLRHLNLYGCEQITDHTVSHIVNGLHSLNHLSLGRCPRLTDLRLPEISRLTHLEYLTLSHCPRITGRSIGDLISRCGTLVRLNLFGCIAIKNDVENILKVRPEISLEKQGLLRNSWDVHCKRAATEHDLLINPYDAQSLAYLAEILHEQGEFARSRVHLAEALALDPDNLIALSLLKAQEDLLHSKVLLEQSLYQDSQNPAALANLGIVFSLQGDHEYAKALLEQARRISPDNAHTLATLGQILYRQGDIINARAHLERALVIYPESLDAHDYLCKVLGVKSINLRTHLEQILINAPNHVPTLVSLGIVCQCQNDLVNSRTNFERAFAREPNNVFTLIALGKVLRIQSDFVNARARLEQAVAIEPKDTYALKQLYWTLIEQGDLVNAQIRIEQALAVKPNDSNALESLGEVLLKKGDLVSAKRRMVEAILLAPGNYGGLIALARILKQQIAIEPNNASLLADLDIVRTRLFSR